MYAHEISEFVFISLNRKRFSGFRDFPLHANHDLSLKYEILLKQKSFYLSPINPQ